MEKIMTGTNGGFGLGPIDAHVHLCLDGKSSPRGWSRRRWVMRPFLAAAARDIGLQGGFGGRDFDRRYLDRLVGCLEGSSLSAAVLLAYDWVRDSSGSPRKDLSDLYVSNQAVFAAARRHSKLLPGVSIHPARPDAFEELERCADQGAALLKLLPCVQNVDCNERRYKPFWKRLAELGLPLLAHTGGEFCVRSVRSDLKSPACLRLPLECGVTVIAAHCGTRALPWDGDHFRTFLEMRDCYANLYGDLSPLSHITHLASLERLREDPARLLHSTDYPVVSAVFPSFLKGWVSRAELRRLNTIDNPLEKKIQLTRAQGFPECVFTDLWELLPNRVVRSFQHQQVN
ncbi:MAG: amidohydrolase family protein [Verrucomicrobia bacterium]|nr:amidohydrolase family protein [Verrucomicrobiota bacterium]